MPSNFPDLSSSRNLQFFWLAIAKIANSKQQGKNTDTETSP
ncbi:MAG: hypothetical protein AAFO76_12960 [Cyanobacteria bacterium J06607_15]